jgi:hypothetical protein
MISLVVDSFQVKSSCTSLINGCFPATSFLTNCPPRMTPRSSSRWIISLLCREIETYLFDPCTKRSCMKGSIGQKSRIREGPSIRIWSHAVALVHIEAHRGAFRTHPVAYRFIETRLAGRMCVDPGGFARIWMLWQVPSEKHCGRMRPDPPGSHESLDVLGSCRIKMSFRLSSSLLNGIVYFVQRCPSKSCLRVTLGLRGQILQKEKICQY